MNQIPKVGDAFPDAALKDHTGKTRSLSDFTKPSQIDHLLGFETGYPLIVVFGRGFFCPRDLEQLRQLVRFQAEINVNYARFVWISVDAPPIHAAFRAGLGANWPFLSDESRDLTRSLGILDDTEGEYAFRPRPFTFVLHPDLRIHRVYDGWYFVGRPTLEELRQNLRAVMRESSSYPYDCWNMDRVKAVRIPAQDWLGEIPALGANGLRVSSGVVKWFDLQSGNGVIQTNSSSNASSEEVFFNFTAIPGEGYRTVRAGANVRFEVVDGLHGLSARNVQETPK
jgi:cold shock CspA family protein/peroxiredoxin